MTKRPVRNGRKFYAFAVAVAVLLAAALYMRPSETTVIGVDELLEDSVRIKSVENGLVTINRKCWGRCLTEWEGIDWNLTVGMAFAVNCEKDGRLSGIDGSKAVFDIMRSARACSKDIMHS